MFNRKIGEIGSILYRALIFPFVRIGIEAKTKSIMKQETYVNKGTKLLGKNYLDRNVYLTNVCLGFGSYIGRNSKASNMRVGKYTSIGCDFRTILGSHPLDTFVSTHPGFYTKDSIFPASYAKENTYEENVYTDKENGYQVEIGNDVWIGASVAVLQGVHIGDGACIGAGSLVTKDVEPYAVYAGVPAKKIKMRFSDEEIKKLQEIRWFDKNEAWIMEHIDEFGDIKTFLKDK
ncbi:MAG: CatB-related O-acetyltransferase [Lachnospiraceae bacterium]|nr:CatB-related O-acetyltransferase [Lachnospiraceae bacterium]